MLFGREESELSDQTQGLLLGFVSQTHRGRSSVRIATFCRHSWVEIELFDVGRLSKSFGEDWKEEYMESIGECYFEALLFANSFHMSSPWCNRRDAAPRLTVATSEEINQRAAAAISWWWSLTMDGKKNGRIFGRWTESTFTRVARFGYAFCEMGQRAWWCLD